MNQQIIICPNCGKEIELSKAFTKQVEEKIRDEYKIKYAEDISKVEEKAKKQVREENTFEISDLKNQVKEKDNKLQEAIRNELELRKRQRELEERENNLEIEKERTIDEERKKIREEVSVKFAEEHRLKDAEKDKEKADLLRQIEDLKRKAEQGSQQTQGEVMEIELENLLRLKFRTDDIAPVPKGVKGGDVIHKIITQLGNYCGTILWESKRTKNWSDGWVQKLKEDQRDIKANVAIIVSTVLPKDIRHIGNVDGVWVVDFFTFIELAEVIRNGMIEVARTKVSQVGKNEKMEVVYNYLSGQEFRQRIEAIVEAFVGMKEDLDAEKRAMERIWSKREQQISRIMKNTSGMYGDLQEIIGRSLLPISKLELPSIEK
ncbi:MAG: DUF2130 domain-containing protein [Ignavibacteriales bacterium]|nr:DUF2130 domain-containing protein [Ignavibacteriales bacterium]